MSAQFCNISKQLQAVVLTTTSDAVVDPTALDTRRPQGQTARLRRLLLMCLVVAPVALVAVAAAAVALHVTRSSKKSTTAKPVQSSPYVSKSWMLRATSPQNRLICCPTGLHCVRKLRAVTRWGQLSCIASFGARQGTQLVLMGVALTYCGNMVGGCGSRTLAPHKLYHACMHATGTHARMLDTWHEAVLMRSVLTSFSPSSKQV